MSGEHLPNRRRIGQCLHSAHGAYEHPPNGGAGSARAQLRPERCPPTCTSAGRRGPSVRSKVPAYRRGVFPTVAARSTGRPGWCSFTACADRSRVQAAVRASEPRGRQSWSGSVEPAGTESVDCWPVASPIRRQLENAPVGYPCVHVTRCGDSPPWFGMLRPGICDVPVRGGSELRKFSGGNRMPKSGGTGQAPRRPVAVASGHFQ